MPRSVENLKDSTRSVTIFGPSNTFRSGISYYVRRLGQALAYDGGIPVRFALFKDMLPKCLFPGKKRVETFSDSFIPFPYSTIDWWNPVSYIASILKASRSDSIVFEWWTGAVGVQYIIAALLLRRKNTILEYHECIDPSENRSPYLQLWTRGCLWALSRLVKQGVFHSEWEMETCPRSLKPRICHIIPHGVYDGYGRTAAYDRKLPQVSFNILFFGLVRDYKGLRYLINAFERSNRPNWRLTVCGEMWDAVSIPDDPRITHIAGYVDDNTVSQVFSEASVVVLPYLRASQSGVSFIAMDYGLPIIASEVGGLGETLENYDGAWLVEPGNVDQLLYALKEVEYMFDAVYPAEVPEKNTWGTIAKMWKEII